MLTEKSIKDCFLFPSVIDVIQRACDVAASHPEALFVFMDRYTHWNGYAGPMVAKLAGHIGQSQAVFLDPSEPDEAQATRALDIAAAVFAATVDEHRDHGHRLPHKTLAQALRKATAEYARLSPERRRELGRRPAWLDRIVRDTIREYGGAPDDPASLLRALGVHAASEVLADREYSMLVAVLRRESRDHGFFRYLKARDFRVELGDQRVHAYAWITLHATYHGRGVEQDHF